MRRVEPRIKSFARRIGQTGGILEAAGPTARQRRRMRAQRQPVAFGQPVEDRRAGCLHGHPIGNQVGSQLRQLMPAAQFRNPSHPPPFGQHLGQGSRIGQKAAGDDRLRHQVQRQAAAVEGRMPIPCTGAADRVALPEVIQRGRGTARATAASALPSAAARAARSRGAQGRPDRSRGGAAQQKGRQGGFNPFRQSRDRTRS